MTEFGSFEPLFGKDTLYITLLNLYGTGLPAAIAAVKASVKRSPDIESEITDLLGHQNWRPHLPAAVSLAFLEPSDTLIMKFWQTFDSGSWVSPQIAAVLSLYDRGFLRHAADRVVRLCPVVDPPTYESTLHKHVEAGPADDYGRSCKAVSSLTSLLRNFLIPDVQSVISREELLAMIAKDVDGGGSIAEGWLIGFKEAIEQCGGGGRR